MSAVCRPAQAWRQDLERHDRDIRPFLWESQIPFLLPSRRDRGTLLLFQLSESLARSNVSSMFLLVSDRLGIWCDSLLTSDIKLKSACHDLACLTRV